MKRKTKRKIKRFYRNSLPIVALVFGVGIAIALPLAASVSFIGAYLLPLPVWLWLIVYRLIVYWFMVLGTLVLISWVLNYIHAKSSAPEITYFEPKNFEKPDEDTIRKAIDGILNTEKVQPFYVHAAPKSKEVETIYLKVKEMGFAMISGGSGQGKSMVAYHAAYRFQEEDRYRSYQLKVELLEGKSGEEITKELLSQLDNLKGRILIIVDDAHKLMTKQDVNIILRQEAQEGHGKYIWIETEFYEEKRERIQSSAYTQVDFQSFFEDLLKNLYETQDPMLQKALQGRIEGLNDAIMRVREGKIKDPWQFAFVASRGEERLAREIQYLSKLELLVLFIISASTILSGESELHMNFVQGKVNKLSFGWLAEDLRKSSVSDALKSLQEQTYKRKSMIRIYDKSVSDRGYIASLHYRWARAVIRASRLRTNLINDLLHSMKELLTSEYRECAYFSVFHSEIGPHAADFDRENKEWLITFLNNLLTDKLGYYAFLLHDVKSVAKDIYDEIISNLDICGIAQKINSIDAEQFGELGSFLAEIGNRRDELIEKLDLEQLSIKANSIEVEQLGELAYFLIVIGNWQNKLIKKLDMKQLSIKANKIEVRQIGQLATLLSAIKIMKCRNELIKKLDMKQLSIKANSVEVGQIEQLAHLLGAFGAYRNELAKKLDLEQLSIKANRLIEVRGISLLASLLNAMEDRRNELIKKLDLEQLSIKANTMKVEQLDQLARILDAMEGRRNELIKKLDLEQLSIKANSIEVEQFGQVTQLLNALGDRRNELIEKLNHNMFVGKANQVDPSNIRALSGFTLFITQLDEECRDKYIRKVPWASICKRCPINTNFIPILGASLENLVKQAEILSNSTGADDVAKHLRAHISEIKQCIIKTHFLQYRGLAKFLWNCNQINHQLAIEICDADTIYELINSFSVLPCNYRGVGELINALYSIDPHSSEFFIKKVYVTITQSINKRDWKEQEEDLKHLIKALYRSVPDFCKRIMADRNLITVDLSSLALDTIYKEVDEEKKVNTAH